MEGGLLLSAGGLPTENLDRALVELCRVATTTLEPGLLAALRRAAKASDGRPRAVLDAMVRAAELSSKGSKPPICQDTGTLHFFVDAGSGFTGLGGIEDRITRAVARSTREVPLRPNTVDVCDGTNPGDNLGRGRPLIHWSVHPGSDLRVVLLAKGGGSDNASMLWMLAPSTGPSRLREAVVSTIAEAGARPCPPLVIGVGVGDGPAGAMALAERALIRPWGERGLQPEWEAELLDAVNALGIGPGGMGGLPTALDVRVEVGMRHPASFPVGVAVQCWVHRVAHLTVDEAGRIEVGVGP